MKENKTSQSIASCSRIDVCGNYVRVSARGGTIGDNLGFCSVLSWCGTAKPQGPLSIIADRMGLLGQASRKWEEGSGHFERILCPECVGFLHRLSYLTSVTNPGGSLPVSWARKWVYLVWTALQIRMQNRTTVASQNAFQTAEFRMFQIWKRYHDAWP